MMGSVLSANSPSLSRQLELDATRVLRVLVVHGHARRLLIRQMSLTYKSYNPHRLQNLLTVLLEQGLLHDTVRAVGRNDDHGELNPKGHNAQDHGRI